MSEYTVLDLFAGLGGFSAAFADSDRWDVTTVEINGEFDPDIEADIFDLRPSDFDQDFDVILASPPCTAFSMAASGTHINSDGEPVSDWGADSIALTKHTVGLISGLNAKYSFIENPMGGMRGILGRPDEHIWWCQYGADRAKPTDFWGDIPTSFDAKRCHNGNQCCHHEAAPRGSDSGTQKSSRSTAERAKLPYGLSEAIRDACEAGLDGDAVEQQTLSSVQ
jgi:hypothetical protein